LTTADEDRAAYGQHPAAKSRSGMRTRTLPTSRRVFDSDAQVVGEELWKFGGEFDPWCNAG
jgi:hypothetical protein